MSPESPPVLAAAPSQRIIADRLFETQPEAPEGELEKHNTVDK